MITRFCLIATILFMLVNSSHEKTQFCSMRMINLLQTTYLNPGIVSAESSLCATIHWGSSWVLWSVIPHLFNNLAPCFATGVSSLCCLVGRSQTGPALLPTVSIVTCQALGLGSVAYQLLLPLKVLGLMLISNSGSDRSFVDDLFESRYCRCWE